MFTKTLTDRQTCIAVCVITIGFDQENIIEKHNVNECRRLKDLICMQVEFLSRRQTILSRSHYTGMLLLLPHTINPTQDLHNFHPFPRRNRYL